MKTFQSLSFCHPHDFLGLHPYAYGLKIIRLWHPGATHLFLEVFGQIVEATPSDQLGLFQYIVPDTATFHDYRIYYKNGLLAHDPYCFFPTFGEMDQYLFGNGVHYELATALGGRIATHQGVLGVKFSVWAPEAVLVSLVADFNYWNRMMTPMRSLGHSGVWEIFIPGLKAKEKYKFSIKTKKGSYLLKSDPMAYRAEMRPATASMIASVDEMEWTDQKWIELRAAKKNQPQPMTIYEVHLGSWRHGKKDNGHLNYRDYAVELVAYCKKMGFTHVEFLPLQEHPLDESWGYQVSGFYAVTSRFGTPEDFQWLVNHFHEHQIGVILDWVPGHFPMDEFSLGRFDGTALYEHEDVRQGVHPHWGTYIFNFGRAEVANFLLANALFWFEKMHVDGLRVDAVASMLYLDYGRNPGEWIPNRDGSHYNLEAIDFFKHLHSIVHQRNFGVLMIAEESTSFPGVTRALDHGGLGFDMKWNMGWMNDTLRYFQQDMLFRKYHQQKLTFGLLYAFSEKFLLVLSHDEVVHEKKSLLSKMPGDYWQKFANLRLLLSYMICQPGKKLLFMGGEIGQWQEWNCKGEVEWCLLDYPAHQGIQKMVMDLNHLYVKNSCLWELDFDYKTFEWVDFSDMEGSVISYIRRNKEHQLLCVHNFTPNHVLNYFICLHGYSKIEEIFNSDHQKYGGSDKINSSLKVLSQGVYIKLAPLATMIFNLKK